MISLKGLNHLGSVYRLIKTYSSVATTRYACKREMNWHQNLREYHSITRIECQESARSLDRRLVHVDFEKY